MRKDRETKRLDAVHALRALDTAPDPAIDRIVSLAADLFDTPLAAASLIDDRRVWPKSQFGAERRETANDIAICFHTILLEPCSVTLIEDLSKDARFQDNPLVQGPNGLRFYASALLTDAAGNNLGTLCVADTSPHPRPSTAKLERLGALAAMIVSELERARDQRVLAEQSRLLKLAETMSGVGHWRFDVVSGGVVWSDEVYRIHGVDRDSFDPMLGSVMDFYHEDDRPTLAAHIEHALTTGEGYQFQLRLIRADGALRHVAAKATCEVGDDGQVLSMFGVFQDVTDQVETLRDVQMRKARYRVLTDNISDVIVRVRLDGTSPYISPAIRDLIGYEPCEMVGRPAHFFVAEADRPAMVAIYDAMAKGQDKADIRHRIVHKDGREIWVETRFRLVRDASGEPVDTVAVIRDISLQKALEADLTQARETAERAAAVKSEFLANMSHELRTPLTSIIGFTGLTTAQPDLPPLARDYVERVENASRALMCTVNDILDFSKLEAGQVTIRLEPTEMASLCRATLDLFAPQAAAKDLNLRIEMDASADATFLVDPDRLRQIVLNLMGNAVKFTAEGEVVLQVRHDAATERLTIAVQDTGDGIARDALDRLFQRFSQIDGSMTRNHGGTGLGLAICKGLVEAMGGDIGADSTVGQGSRFWFSVPARPMAAALPGVEIGPDLPTFAGLRVLVVDDHAANRDLARLFLSGVGAEVTDVEDGDAACVAAAECPYDAILMDLRMPGLDGYGALARIRAEGGPNDMTPILAFSADAGPDENQRLLAFGFDDVVAKPVDAGTLLTAVARATAFLSDAPQNLTMDQPMEATHVG